MAMTRKQKGDMVKGFGKLAQAFAAGMATKKKKKKPQGNANMSGTPQPSKPCGACG